MTAGPWEQYQTSKPAPPGPWTAYQNPEQQRTARGITDALVAGWQGSATGLAVRGRLPDVVLDAQHSKWYESLASGAAQMASEFPEMVAGSLGGLAAGAAAGSAVPVLGTAVGGVVGAGAGAFAAPAALRTALMERYTKGEVTSAGEFLSRTGIVLKSAGKEAAVGALTSGAGAAATRLGAPLVDAAVMSGEKALVAGTTQRVAAGAAVAELGTMTVAPAALEGRLPEPEDFTNAAILMVGMKGAHLAAGKLREVYSRTGVRPEQALSDAQKDPTIVEDLAKPAEAPAPDGKVRWDPMSWEEAIPRAYEPLAAEQNAIEAVPGVRPAPGVKAGEVVAETFAPWAQATGEPARPTEVNYNYISRTADVRGATARLSQIYEAEIQTQRRGTVSWEQTQMEAGQHVAELLGSTEPFKPREPGTAAGAAELLARKQMLVGAAEDMATKARELLPLGTDATPEQVAAFLQSIDRASMIQAEFLGARAEAGRTLNILKETKVSAERAAQIQELISRFGKDPMELAKMMADMDNPASALKFAVKATKATTWDMVVEGYKSALVSGPITQIANVMGNVSFMATRPFVDAAAAAFGRVTGATERVSAVEPLARIIGDLHGVMDGLRLVPETFLSDTPGGKAEHKQAIPGLAGYLTRVPFRALAAGDVLFRAMSERGEAYAMGARQAAKEGLNPATREFRQRVAEIANNPTKAQAEQIAAAGKRFTFNSPLGEKGRAVNQFVKAWHLEWAIPFISTPGNVFKEMARLTPAAPIIGEWRADIAKGGPAAAKAAAEMALGTGLSAVVMSLAVAGNVSGSGDPDPNKRRVQMAAGWQPYSIKIGNTWHSYQRLQPVGTLMGMAADMADVWEHLTPEESDKVPKILATAFANAVTNQTFLQGLSNVVGALSEPDRKGPQFVQNLAGSLVPAALGQTAQLMDPYQRQLDSIRDAVQNRIPGLREQLMPQRDPFGEPVASAERLGGISPITTKDQSTDKVRLEAARLGIGEGKAPKSISLPSGGTGTGGVELTPQQRDVFGDVAGHLAYRVMDQMVNSFGWDYMPDLVKEQAYKKVFEKAHQAGKAAALTDEQRQQEVVRIVGEVSKKLAPGVEK